MSDRHTLYIYEMSIFGTLILCAHKFYLWVHCTVLKGTKHAVLNNRPHEGNYHRLRNERNERTGVLIRMNDAESLIIRLELGIA